MYDVHDCACRSRSRTDEHEYGAAGSPTQAPSPAGAPHRPCPSVAASGAFATRISAPIQRGERACEGDRSEDGGVQDEPVHVEVDKRALKDKRPVHHARQPQRSEGANRQQDRGGEGIITRLVGEPQQRRGDVRRRPHVGGELEHRPDSACASVDAQGGDAQPLAQRSGAREGGRPQNGARRRELQGGGRTEGGGRDVAGAAAAARRRARRAVGSQVGGGEGDEGGEVGCARADEARLAHPAPRGGEVVVIGLERDEVGDERVKRRDRDASKLLVPRRVLGGHAPARGRPVQPRVPLLPASARHPAAEAAHVRLDLPRLELLRVVQQRREDEARGDRPSGPRGEEEPVRDGPDVRHAEKDKHVGGDVEVRVRKARVQLVVGRVKH
mmetsp:Transcript_19948/g.63647  ORF Transcript_19948/g.63647 Transcript_19948/m.63647 type:complete len:385 (-) Transcript_19948:1003-2157(-)